MAIFALLIVQINFGLLPVAQKIILQSLTPWSLLGVRTAAAALVFVLIYWVWSWRQRTPLVLAESLVPPRTFAYLSLLGISANQFMLLVALTMTTAVAAVIVVPSITLFTFLFALVLKRESFSWQKLAILTLGLSGVFILFADSFWQMLNGLDTRAFIGNLLCLASAIVYALYLVLSRDWVGKLPALQFTSRLFIYSQFWTVVFLGLGYAFLETETFWLQANASQIPATSWWALLFVVLGPTVLNYFLNFWSLRDLSASTVSGFVSLQTLVGATFAYLVLGEPLKASYGLAAFCILLSVVLLAWQSLGKKSA